MDVLSSTDVRKNWSETLDSVVRERPAYIKRTRDNLALMNIIRFLSFFRDTGLLFKSM